MTRKVRSGEERKRDKDRNNEIEERLLGKERCGEHKTKMGEVEARDGFVIFSIFFVRPQVRKDDKKSHKKDNLFSPIFVSPLRDYAISASALSSFLPPFLLIFCSFLLSLFLYSLSLFPSRDQLQRPRLN